MIIGSGLLAQAFSSEYAERDDICIYSAGVSNSHCIDIFEFNREQQRLEDALKSVNRFNVFVYFGTCSVADPDSIHTPYVQHKLAMERIVAHYSNSLILRLPQVAGKTPNPHTLLNFLFSHISRGERFKLWSKAQRNIIDVVDVVSIAGNLISNDFMRGVTINVANTINYTMTEIVQAMEGAIGKKAIFDEVSQGGAYHIDVKSLTEIIKNSNVNFDEKYLDRITAKYYRGRMDS